MEIHKNYFNLIELKNIKNCFIDNSEKFDSCPYVSNGKMLINRNSFAGNYNGRIKNKLHSITGYADPAADIFITLFEGGTIYTHKDCGQFNGVTIIKKADKGGEFIVDNKTINLNVGDLFLFDAEVEHLVTPAFGGYEIVSFGFFKKKF